jgi:hypothetical protein
MAMAKMHWGTDWKVLPITVLYRGCCAVILAYCHQPSLSLKFFCASSCISQKRDGKNLFFGNYFYFQFLCYFPELHAIRC